MNINSSKYPCQTAASSTLQTYEKIFYMCKRHHNKTDNLKVASKGRVKLQALRFYLQLRC